MAEETIEELKKACASDKVYKNLLNEIEALQSTVTSLKSNGSTTYKLEIKRLLEHEIVSRYYLKKGAVEASLDQDMDLKKAIEILNNKNKYIDLLASNK